MRKKAENIFTFNKSRTKIPFGMSPFSYIEKVIRIGTVIVLKRMTFSI